ncbi:MAG: hypothetical protein KGH62_01960 [Candidatus Micrarchaeota archaeon]|nr:hypothetical protein [Candidatus Micrarchaeota archaeon]
MPSKNPIIAVAAVVIIAVLIFGVGLQSIGYQNNNCAYVNGIATAACSQFVNGTVTGLSQVIIRSNYGPFNGAAWLVNLVVNGGGQGVFGTTSQQVASQFNSSATVTQNNKISISTSLISQKIAFPYSYSGMSLVQDQIKYIIFPFSWFSNGAGSLTSCSQANQSASNNFYLVTCSGLQANADLSSAFSGYNSQCISASGLTFVNASGTLNIFGFPVASSYALQCINVTAAPVDQVLYAGSPRVDSNVSVTFNNGTSSRTFFLTTQVPQQSFQNILTAQIYGYSTGALNTYIGSVAPIMLISSSGNAYFVPFQSTQTVQNLNQIPSSCFQSAGLQIGGQPVPYIYNPKPLQSCIVQQNTNINNLQTQSQQIQAPFANMQPSYVTNVRSTDPALNTGAPWYGVTTVTNNPVFFPQVQMIVSAQTLGINIPVAYPYIKSMSPNPLIIKSASTNGVSVTVGNNATVAASAYIVVSNQSGSIVTQTPNFNIPAKGTSTQSVSIGAYNPNLANLQAQDLVTVYSSQQTSIFSSAILSLTVQPNCPPGSVYVNNTNCVSPNNSCQAGYTWNGTACSFICAPPAIWNATSNKCYVNTTPPVPGTPWLLYIILGLIVVAVVVFIIAGRKK